MFDEAVPTDTGGIFSGSTLNKSVTPTNRIFVPVERPFFLGVPIVGTESGEIVERQFKELAKEWVADTAFTSSMRRIVESEPYQEIIALGRVMETVVVRLILDDLRAAPRHWFTALYEITGDDPVKRSEAGNLRAMTAAWLGWGRTHGYIN